MLSLEESLKILKETNALLEGHFILSSGLHSPQYVQCAQLMSKPTMANKICTSLSEKIKKEYLKFSFDLQIKDLKNFTNLISQIKQNNLNFKIIRHKKKKNAFIRRIFENFKKN